MYFFVLISHFSQKQDVDTKAKIFQANIKKHVSDGLDLLRILFPLDLIATIDLPPCFPSLSW